MTTRPEERGLIMDYGGVLTTSAGRSIRAFERAEGLPKGTMFEILAAAYEQGGSEHPIARLETGAADILEFEEAMLAELRRRGFEVAPGDLHRRILHGLELDDAMWELVRRAREAGVRTCLLSNSWGRDGYPQRRLEAHFDALVISAEVGLRKPDPAIYRLACDRIGLPPEACAFVDDHPRNAEAAAALGMLAVHHVGDLEATARRLEGFLGVELA